jgi:hypothetical protein
VSEKLELNKSKRFQSQKENHYEYGKENRAMSQGRPKAAGTGRFVRQIAGRRIRPGYYNTSVVSAQVVCPYGPVNLTLASSRSSGHCNRGFAAFELWGH